MNNHFSALLEKYEQTDTALSVDHNTYESKWEGGYFKALLKVVAEINTLEHFPVSNFTDLVRVCGILHLGDQILLSALEKPLSAEMWDSHRREMRRQSECRFVQQWGENRWLCIARHLAIPEYQAYIGDAGNGQFKNLLYDELCLALTRIARSGYDFGVEKVDMDLLHELDALEATLSKIFEGQPVEFFVSSPVRLVNIGERTVSAGTWAANTATWMMRTFPNFKHSIQ